MPLKIMKYLLKTILFNDFLYFSLALFSEFSSIGHCTWKILNFSVSIWITLWQVCYYQKICCINTTIHVGFV